MLQIDEAILEPITSHRGDRGREDVAVWPSSHAELRRGDGVNALIPKLLRELACIHLVEEKPHRVSAASVS